MREQIITNILDNFTDAIDVGINDKICNQCQSFAQEVNSTTKYGDCGQNNMDKRQFDNFVGKIAEFGVYAVLSKMGKEYNFTINLPDCNIYKGKEKSWRSDFCIQSTVDENIKLDIAVKGQALTQAKKYELSGTFQIASFRKDNVFTKPDELVFLCLVDDISDKYRVLVLPPKQIKNIKFSDPKIPKFKGLKSCYYAKDNFDKEKLDFWLSDYNL